MVTAESDYRRKVQSVAQHEMGHYVVSRKFGFITGSVSVQVDAVGPGYRGSSQIALGVPIDSIAVLETYLLQRCIILNAGAIAEVLFDGSSEKKIGEEDEDRAIEILDDPASGAFIDRALDCELRALLRNVRHPATQAWDTDAITREMRAIQLEVWGKAVEIINQHYEIICVLASEVANRVAVEGERGVMSAKELEAHPTIAAMGQSKYYSKI